MLKALKRVFEDAPADTHAASAQERRQLHIAVAVLLHEARRADYDESNAESAAAVRALADLFGLDPQESATLLEQGRERAEQLTSFYAPVTVVKREFSLSDRVRLVEHL